MIHSRRKLALVVGDLALCFLSLWFSLITRRLGLVSEEKFLLHALSFTPVFLVWLTVLYTIGLYDFRRMRNLIGIVQDLLWAVCANLLIGASIFYALSPYHGLTPKTHMFLAVVISHLMFLVWRHIWVRLFSSRMLVQRVAFLGSDEIIEGIKSDLATHPQLGFRTVSTPIPIPENRPRHWRPRRNGKRIAGETPDMIVIPWDTLTDSGDKFRTLFATAISDDIPVLTGTDFFEFLYGKIPPAHAARPEWLLTNILSRQQRDYEVFKRWIDFGGAAAGLALFSPVLALITGVSLATGMRSPLYSQVRFGYKGREFRIWKFRTMLEGSDRKGPFDKSENDERITRWGALLRRFRLDELPQLWNVLKGDMSIVGPRPEWMAEVEVLEREVPHYHLRHMVKPGITGWAQVNFRASLGPRDSLEKLQYELYYVKHLSLALDIGIILKTFKRVFQSERSFKAPNALPRSLSAPKATDAV